MTGEDEVPVEYRLEHLLQQLAADPDVAETDVVLERCGDRLVVSANVATDARRDALLAAVRARWDGEVGDEVEVLTHLADTERPVP